MMLGIHERRRRLETKAYERFARVTATFGDVAVLTPGVAYEFTVLAGNAAGRSDASGPVVVYPCEVKKAKPWGKRNISSRCAAIALDFLPASQSGPRVKVGVKMKWNFSTPCTVDILSSSFAHDKEARDTRDTAG